MAYSVVGPTVSSREKSLLYLRMTVQTRDRAITQNA